MKLNPTILRFSGRDIIRVELDDGSIQPFYRSTGKNSGMKDEWLPFNGISLYFGLWFDKNGYIEGDWYRYGSEELFRISKKLAELNIGPGEIKTPYEINLFLNTPASLSFNELDCIREWRFEDGENMRYYK